MRLLPGSKFKNFFIWSANFLRMWPDSCATLFHEPDADMLARFIQRNYAKFTTIQFATPWLTIAIYPWSFLCLIWRCYLHVNLC